MPGRAAPAAHRRRLRVQQPPRPRPLPGPVRRPGTGCSPRSWAARARSATASAAASTSCATGYLSTGVQGESAAGGRRRRAAPQARRAGRGWRCVYIGDGTWGEGAVYEALNMAALWRLPLLVVVENNGIAQSTPTDRAARRTHRRAGRRRSASTTSRVASTDTAVVRRALRAGARTRVRASGRAVVVEFAHPPRSARTARATTPAAADELAYAQATTGTPRYARRHPDAVRPRSTRGTAHGSRRSSDEVAARPPAAGRTADAAERVGGEPQPGAARAARRRPGVYAARRGHRSTRTAGRSR